MTGPDGRRRPQPRAERPAGRQHGLPPAAPRLHRAHARCTPALCLPAPPSEAFEANMVNTATEGHQSSQVPRRLSSKSVSAVPSMYYAGVEHAPCTSTCSAAPSPGSPKPRRAEPVSSLAAAYSMDETRRALDLACSSAGCPSPFEAENSLTKQASRTPLSNAGVTRPRRQLFNSALRSALHGG